MTIARIHDGSVVEMRSDIALGDVPEHKRGAWRTLTGSPPAYSAGVQRLVGPSYVIGPEEVTQSWEVVPRDRLEQIAAVKAEAQRRIVARSGAPTFEVSLVKQLNALMRASELTDKKATGQSLTDAERAEETALRGFADAIKAIRAKSDEIEAMNPVPADYAADLRWS